MKIAIGSDPNAKKAKEELIEYLKQKGCNEITDFGSEDTIYANVAIKVAEAVAKKKYDTGILLCGTGIGVSVAANKVKGAYAALITDVYSAKRARLSNNANIACIGAFTTGSKIRQELIDAFLDNCYEPGGPSEDKVRAYISYDMHRG